MTDSKWKKYDYEKAVKASAFYEDNGSVRSPVKRVLRKLVRDAVAKGCMEMAGQRLGPKHADRIAKELVP